MSIIKLKINLKNDMSIFDTITPEDIIRYFIFSLNKVKNVCRHNEV